MLEAQNLLNVVVVITFSLDDIVPEYGVSSREIVDSLCNSIENLKVKHPLHVHCNNLGMAGNINTILRYY